MTASQSASGAMTATATPGAVVHLVVAGEVGGAERMLASLARPAGGPRRHLVALLSDAPAPAALFARARVEVVRPPAHAARRWSWPLPAGTIGGAGVAWLASLLRANAAVAVQLHTFASHMMGTRAGWLAGVPVIRTEHSTRVYDHWLCRPFSAWALRRASAVVAVSDHLRRHIAARASGLAAPVLVIPNGVAWCAVAPPPLPATGPLRLGLVARLEPRKGVDRALAALALAGAPADIQLDIVGDGPCRPALQRQAAALGLAGRARFWGYRPDPETVIAATDAVVCSSRQEGLGVALLEAMALGRPVIATPVGGVPEIVGDGDTGWLARDGSVDALAAALTAAARAGRAEIGRRGARARATVERRFTEAHMRAAYEAVYRSLEQAAPLSPAGSLRRAG
ncbi:MAG TPA: glycosyltransferase family 4 protein [Polyangia bacterium]|jgi:glycosyltransferase involved in cell wall biosynthesis|nr:glycosyltransferase family 4 protein [Polyangia bacterium]